MSPATIRQASGTGVMGVSPSHKAEPQACHQRVLNGPIGKVAAIV